MKKKRRFGRRVFCVLIVLFMGVIWPVSYTHLIFLLQRNVLQEFCNSDQKKFDGIKILQTDTIKSQSEAAGDSGVVSYQT